MRFVSDGPEIPNSLIKRWREGRVVFLAGAGISMAAPSNLPSFRDLVLRVYRRLNDSLFPLLELALRQPTPSERDALIRGASLSPQQHVEASLFFAGEYDRLFSALERRTDQDALGRMSSRRVRDAVEEVLRGHGGHSQGHRDLVSVAATGCVGPMSIGRQACRLITTNFDLLLEDAWRHELGTEPIAYDARVAPRPGAFDFQGIVHLHGLLNPDVRKPASMVLTSRDFARTYLRSGVIANYVYDLVRRYTVVLVGYSADDPAMRYLMDAIGEDAALFEDMHQPYAIASRQPSTGFDADGAIFAETWRAKNIEPIVYEFRPGPSPFAPLWETLTEWADWARSDTAWALQRLKRATALPFDRAAPFDRTLVENFFDILDETEQLAAVEHLKGPTGDDVDFSWIETLTREAL